VTDAVNVSCPECGSSAGDPCRDRYARAKPTCAARSNAVALRTTAAPKPPVEPKPAKRAKPAPAPVAAPAPAPNPEPAAFDEHTPPPKGRPIGEPVSAYTVLPPGEDVVETFRAWDRDGRIPAASVLLSWPLNEWLASGAPAPTPADLDGYRVAVVVVVRPGGSAKWVVLAPIEGDRKCS